MTSIYCSAATKELLLRLEKYPHRLNFARGILEARKVHFKHLKNFLKPIPLETPTRIELSPGNDIQVTLFDANHCTGAVMFLFEGHGKAVLYTGDIRSEPWMVNNLSRNPLLIEYTSGLKTLDCIYLDTSNTKDITFPTKAAGLQELLSKVSKYPPDTVFHFEAWTFGYEEVFMALSKSLKSQIHVDRYKLKLYQSLRGDSSGAASSSNSGPFLAHEGPILTGYTCGNTPQNGCLTSDTDVRIHSCEKGMHCSVLNEKTVWIRPIITRREGEEMPEIGVGGGGGDLNQHPDLVLHDDVAIDQLMGLFDDVDQDVKMDIKKMLSTGIGANGRSISLDGMNLDRDENELSLTQMAKIMARSVARKRRSSNSQNLETLNYDGEELPRVITFPYSRHSSYEELVHLVGAFNPRDVYPCTVHEDRWIQEKFSIGDLFGHQCSAKNFRHDREMAEMFPDRSQLATQDSQVTTPQSSQALTESPRRRTGPLDEPSVFFHKDAQSRLRRFQDDDNDHSQVSPPQRITAVTPGAESQSLRRKAIFDELGGDSKRVRLQDQSEVVRPPLEENNGTNKFLGAAQNTRHDPQTTSRPDRAQPTEINPKVSSLAEHIRRAQQILPLVSVQVIKKALLSSRGSFDNAIIMLVGSGKNFNPHNVAQLVPSIDIPDAEIESPGADTPGSEIDTNSESDANGLMYFDDDDGVYRCTACFNEMWTTEDPFCTNCDDGENGFPYYEEVEPVLGPAYKPIITLDQYTDQELEGEDRLAIVGDYLDDDSSAYDTQDSQYKFDPGEYEQNSFINDAASDMEEEANSDNGSSSDTEEDIWKAKYQELLTSYTTLASDHRMLDFEYRDLKMEIGLDDDEDDDDERDEDGMLIIGIPEPRILTTEVIISSDEEQSDSSEIPEDRIMRRAEAFEAVNGVSGRSWHEISLVSTTNNHTHEEIEL